MTPAPYLSGLVIAVAGSAWVALALNLPVYLVRAREIHGKHPVSDALLELSLIWSVTLGIFCLGWLFGRTIFRIVGVALMLVSATCAYYMAHFNVVIGFGVVNAIVTTDHVLSREAVGIDFAMWLLVLGALPAWLLWRFVGAYTSWWRMRGRWLSVSAVSLGLISSALAFDRVNGALAVEGKRLASKNMESVSLSGAIAHAYVPTNWLAGAGMVLHSRILDWQASKTLVNPADRFDYQPTTSWDGLHVVLVIGETARFDRMTLLGHDRLTTPRLIRETGVIPFAAQSCDTSTRLSLACMFVRREAVTEGRNGTPDLISEDNVFAVFDRLGFDIDLYALQSEVWFYGRTRADNYKFREIITAQPQNHNRPVHDSLLLPELRRSLDRPNPERQPRLTILHTKGSHFLYSKRYPREFAAWQPECMGVDHSCAKEHLLNSFDNSILFTDHLLAEVIEMLRHRRAVMIYVSDHGESIGDGLHFHATPRFVAPIDQRKVPLIFWFSEQWRSEPNVTPRWRELVERSKRVAPLEVGHQNLYPSLLSCLGVQSGNGGITADLDLCHPGDQDKSRAPGRP